MRARDVPARDRLLAKLAPQPNGCWHWTGFIDKAGYGRIGYRGRRSETLQRAVYMEFVGPIPEGHDIDHRCHSEDDPTCPGGSDCLHRRCGNPEHLRPLVRVENGRLGKTRVTRCPEGHPYSPENTRVTGGRRFCKTCNRAAKARQRAARKAAA